MPIAGIGGHLVGRLVDREGCEYTVKRNMNFTHLVDALF
jgi:hypothetical protein